jgi:maltose alpha-D-glucosyltransferase/alpha-amylase
VLPKFLGTQRWFASKGQQVQRVELNHRTEWKRAEGEWLLATACIQVEGNEVGQYFLPLTFVWQDPDDVRASPLLPFALAKIRQRASAGLLCDAFADPAFCRALVQSMKDRQLIPFGSGQLVFSTSARSELLENLPETVALRRPLSQSSNTAVILSDRLFLKCYRNIRYGLNPELEIGRFLTEVSPFPNIIPVVGALEYHSDNGTSTLALLQSYIDNQGDAWNYTVDYLERFLERRAMQPIDETQTDDDNHENFLLLIQRLGLRTGELHRALAKTTGDPAFDPEPVTASDLQQWSQSMQDDLEQAMQILQHHTETGAHAHAASLVGGILALRPQMAARIEMLKRAQIDMLKTRHHGDYHLGQALVAENDFVIIDFEGEPGRPLSERRTKHLALRDAAGLLRSLDYAAQTALWRVTADRPQDLERLQPVVDNWRNLACKVFLEGYEQATRHSPVHPGNPETLSELIDLFMLEKALYEIVYELNNRPDWVSIPLQGLLDLLENGNPETRSRSPE